MSFKLNHRTVVSSPHSAWGMLLILTLLTASLAGSGGGVAAEVGAERLSTTIRLPVILRNYVNQASGILDTSFGGDGRVTTDFAGGNDDGQAIALQLDGRILVAGSADNGSTIDFALARYLADGSLDITFDSDGKVTTDFTGGSDYGYAMVLQANGNILVAGSSYTGSSDDFALARYQPDGSLDASFGSDGLVITDFAGFSDIGLAITLQPDGRIVVAGGAGNGSNSDFALARYR